MSNLSAISAPYRFIPLSKWVHSPSWVNSISQDYPFKDGLSGELTIELTNNTPLLIGGQRTQDTPAKVYPYQTPEGKYAIPGTTIRGLLRSITEIISFSKMSFVDDIKRGYRDISRGATIYSKRVNGNSKQIKAGWLCFKDGKWLIKPCEFTSVETEKLSKFASKPITCKGRATDDNVQIKYGKLPLSNKIQFDLSAGGKVTTLGDGAITGQVVFTGAMNSKTSDFIFHSTGNQAITVNTKVYKDFLSAHSNPESQEWLALLQQQVQRRHVQGVPVFFLQKGNHVDLIGLAKMPRMAWDLSSHDAIKNTSSMHFDNDIADFTEGLFGYVNDTECLKSRVSFGLLQAEYAEVTHYGQTILGQPSPTFHPSYLMQPGKGNKLEGKQYVTMWDATAELAGRKRYQVADSVIEPEAVDKINVASDLYPIQAGAKFTGKVRFHNIKPEELGALVWALTYGGNDALCHNLGMAKPLGFGNCKIAITEHNIIAQHGSVTPKQSMASFERYMDVVYQTAFRNKEWLNAPQIKQLLTMAKPVSKPSKHMALSEFASAKKTGNMLILPKISADTENPLSAPKEDSLVNWMEKGKQAFTEIAKQQQQAELKAQQQAEIQAKKAAMTPSEQMIFDVSELTNALVGKKIPTQQLDDIRKQIKALADFVAERGDESEKSKARDTFKEAAKLVGKDHKTKALKPYWSKLN